MSSDGYFDEDINFDDSALAQLDAIEAAHFSPGKSNTTSNRLAAASSSSVTHKAPSRPSLKSGDSSFYDMSLDIDEAELAKLDKFVEDAIQGKAKPVAGPSKFQRTSSSNTLQTTLFGDVIYPSSQNSTNKQRTLSQRPKSSQRNTVAQQPKKTKTWDRTAYAPTGQRKRVKDKGKGKATDGGDDEEQVEFEQFPEPSVSYLNNFQPPPMKLEPDLLEARRWTYPINRPKRDYQYNIVRHCLFDNTLVALPTGLGKTFIAGVVMLNYYRWFPEGKVVFVAPTKPLVAQQAVACHETCGIPGEDSVVMTGEVLVSKRRRFWEEKRVFFMTSQTLENDLAKQNMDARDIVLLVIDEAHRATGGDHSYNKVVRLMMDKNPHFRILALTATPASKPEGVQEVIDGLHISRIEIRNEQSLDLQKYIHKKTFVPHLIKASPPIVKVRDLLVKVMNGYMQPLVKAGILRQNESAVSMHPYRPQAAMQNLEQSRGYLRPSLAILSQLARAMLYLITGCIESCHNFLLAASKPVEEKDRNKCKRMTEDPNFKALMQELDTQKATGYSIHPKVEELLNILIQHFGQQEGEDETRVMVFSSFREVVERIVTELNKHAPLVRATRFVGQGTDKSGNKGVTQKDQLEILEKFKAGTFNVIVATSIGEEGLDIGEIDVTICYDADKAPTRMIQRFGRTGRKRAGTIHALLAEEREEFNIEKAEAAYFEVQKLIAKGEMFELYSDVERLIPAHIKPVCDEKIVEIKPYVMEKKSPRKKAAAGQGTKRKRNDEIDRNIPEGASRGFVSVKDLIVKGASKKQKKLVVKDFDACGEDDETDEDIVSGRVAAPRRTQSAAAGSSTTSGKTAKSKAKLRKAATMGGEKAAAKKKGKKRAKEEEESLSQFSRQGQDDSDDMDILEGAVSRRKRTKVVNSDEEQEQEHQERDKNDVMVLEDEEDYYGVPRSHSRPSSWDMEVEDTDMPPLRNHKNTTLGLSPIPERTSRSKKKSRDFLELSDSDFDDGPASPCPPPRKLSHQPSSSPPRASSANAVVDSRDEQDFSWLVEGDDDDNHLQFEIVDSSPLAPKQSPLMQRVEADDESFEISQVRKADKSPTQSRRRGLVTALDNNAQNKRKPIEESHSSSPTVLTSKYANIPPSLRSPIRQASPGPSAYSLMPPPALPPSRFKVPDTLSSPEQSQPVRAVGPKHKKRSIIVDVDDEDDEPPPQRRLHRMESTPARNSRDAQPKEKKTKSRRSKPSLLDRNVNPIFDGEAAHSGDEVSEGHSSGEEDEDEYDREFIKDSPYTQASPSYEQTQIYRRSLMTQLPPKPGFGEAGPAFANGPARQRKFGNIDGPRRKYNFPSSSPPPPDEELDNYEYGTFVVEDDAEISYEAGDDSLWG